MELNKITNFIGCETNYDDADTVIFGAPFDGTTSYRPGTRFAPAKIRAESYGIETYSPYCDRDLSELKVCDIGDLDLPFGATARVLDMIYGAVKTIFDDRKLPVMLGGEHLVSLPAIRAAAEKYNDLCIIHFDAHTDLRDEYLGEKLSHSSVIRRVHEIVGDGKIFQFCIRSGEKQEFEFAKKHTTLQRFDFTRLDSAIAKIGVRPIYLTIDLDCLDPSEFPGTGTPEAGGVSFNLMLKAMQEICKNNVIGADLVELSPPLDNSGISTALTCKALRELLLLLKK